MAIVATTFLLPSPNPSTAEPPPAFDTIQIDYNYDIRMVYPNKVYQLPDSSSFALYGGYEEPLTVTLNSPTGEHEQQFYSLYFAREYINDWIQYEK